MGRKMIFRLIQGEVEETRFSVLQQATEKSPDVAATWFEQEVSRQQLQETFTAQTKCSEWEAAKEAYPNYSTKLEELVGLPRKQKETHIKSITMDAVATNDDISAGENVLDIQISITKGQKKLTGDKLQKIKSKYTKKILSDLLKLQKEEIEAEQ